MRKWMLQPVRHCASGELPVPQSLFRWLDKLLGPLPEPRGLDTMNVPPPVPSSQLADTLTTAAPADYDD